MCLGEFLELAGGAVFDPTVAATVQMQGGDGRSGRRVAPTRQVAELGNLGDLHKRIFAEPRKWSTASGLRLSTGSIRSAADVAIGTRLPEDLVGEDGGGRWLLNAWGCLRPSPHDGTLTQPMSQSTAFRRIPRPHFGKPNCPALSGEIRAAMVAAVGGES
jgi:hypothetical protein